MNYAPDAENLDTSAQWSRAVNDTGHYLTKVASWRTRGSDVIGQMQGCVRCGLVIINDRRGVLLIAPGGFNQMHKRIFPCQISPLCQGPAFKDIYSRTIVSHSAGRESRPTHSVREDRIVTDKTCVLCE